MGQSNPQLRDMARQLLERERRQAEKPADVGEASERTFQRLQEHMSNLIGRVGFQALMTRAAHLTRAEAGWIESIAIERESRVTLQGLDVVLEREGAARAMEGMVLLLANLIGLLCTFIGEELTLRLLRRIWEEIPRLTPGSKEGE